MSITGVIPVSGGMGVLGKGEAGAKKVLEAHGVWGFFRKPARTSRDV